MGNPCARCGAIPLKGRGLCGACYNRAYRSGTLPAPLTKTPIVSERRVTAEGVWLTLRSGHAILVDARDEALVRERPFNVQVLGGIARVVAKVGGRKAPTSLYLNRVLMQADDRDDVLHRNHNTLDLRRDNLVALPRDRDRICSPFSPDRLRELYWKLGESRKDIARRAADYYGLDKCLSENTAGRWLQKAGLSLRTQAHANQVSYLRHRKIREALRQERHRSKKGRPTRTDQLFTQKAIARNAQARIRRETRECCLPGCHKPITRKPGDFGDAWYCTKSHAGKASAAGRTRREHGYLSAAKYGRL